MPLQTSLLDILGPRMPPARRASAASPSQQAGSVRPSSTMRRTDLSPHAPEPGLHSDQHRHHRQQQQTALPARNPTYGPSSSASGASSSSLAPSKQTEPSEPGSSQDNAIILSPDASPSPPHAGVPSSFEDDGRNVDLPEGEAPESSRAHNQGVPQASNGSHHEPGIGESLLPTLQPRQDSSSRAINEAQHNQAQPLAHRPQDTNRSPPEKATLPFSLGHTTSPPTGGRSDVSHSSTSADQPTPSSSKSPLREAGSPSRPPALAASHHAYSASLDTARSPSPAKAPQPVHGASSSAQSPSSLPGPSTSGVPFWTATHDRLLIAAVQRWGLAFDAIQTEFNTSSNDKRSLKALKVRWRTLVLFSDPIPQLEAAIRVATGKRPDGPILWSRAELGVVRKGLAQGKGSSDIFAEYVDTFPSSTRTKAAVQGKASSLRKGEDSTGEAGDEQDGGDIEGSSQDDQGHGDEEDVGMAGEPSVTAARSPPLPSNGHQQKLDASRAQGPDQDLVPDDEDEAFETKSLMAFEAPRSESEAVERGKHPAEDQPSDDPRSAGESSPSSLMSIASLCTTTETNALVQSMQQKKRMADLVADEAATSRRTKRDRTPVEIRIGQLRDEGLGMVEDDGRDAKGLSQEGEGIGHGEYLVVARQPASAAFDTTSASHGLNHGGGNSHQPLRAALTAIGSRSTALLQTSSAAGPSRRPSRPQQPCTTGRGSNNPRVWTEHDDDLLLTAVQRYASSGPVDWQQLADFFNPRSNKERTSKALAARWYGLGGSSEAAQQIATAAAASGSAAAAQSRHHQQSLGTNGDRGRSDAQVSEEEAAEEENSGTDASMAESGPQLADQAHRFHSPLVIAPSENSQQPHSSRRIASHLPPRVDYEANGVLVDGVVPGLEVLVYAADRVELVEGDPTSPTPAATFSPRDKRPAFHLRVQSDGRVTGHIVPQGTTLSASYVCQGVASEGVGGGGGGGGEEEVGTMVLRSRIVGPCGYSIALVMY